MKVFLFACVCLLALLSAPVTPLVAGTPNQIWVAYSDQLDSTGERLIEQAWHTDARVLDRFPDAFVLQDVGSAQTLQQAGLRVEGPFPLTPSRTVTLVRQRWSDRDLQFPIALWEQSGARLVWRRGQDAIVESPGPLPEFEGEGVLWKQKLRDRLLRQPLPRLAEAPGAPGHAATTSFLAVIQDMVQQLDPVAYMDWIRNLSGANQVVIGGAPHTLATRSTPTTSCDLAEQYVFEQFQAMGFTDVEYDPYSFTGASARNVIATLPGVETPEHIYIIGAHLDSTSPQAATNAPGANDNASGVAAVLEIARILKDYTFRSTIKFIAFTGEEQGLYGSSHYAAQAALRGDLIEGVVICDMIAWYFNQYRIDIEGELAWEPLMLVMKDACSTYTALGTNLVYNSWGSDHVPFQNEGFPAFLAVEAEYAFYPCYHQPCDTADQNNADFGVDVARACLATVAHLADPVVFAIAHTPLQSTDDQVGPYEVVATISQVHPLAAGQPVLHYSTGVSFTDLQMSPTGNAEEYSVSIPGQPTGTVISYYISAQDTSGAIIESPQGAPASLYEFSVLVLQTAFFEDFESGAAGWTHGGTHDDWQLGAPLGLADDPLNAYSGSQVFGTDLTGLEDPGKYENSADTWLASPVFSCVGLTSVKLSFQRWLAIERSNGGAWDYARIYVNEAKIWESPSGANLVDTAWVLQEIDISGVAADSDSVQLRFTLHSDTNVNFGGWNLDDVQVTGLGLGSATSLGGPLVVDRIVLHPNYPNPHQLATQFRFEIPAPGRVEFSIYDVRGRLVRTLLSEPLNAGEHSLIWDGRVNGGAKASAGVYFYRVSGPGGVQTRKMSVLR